MRINRYAVYAIARYAGYLWRIMARKLDDTPSMTQPRKMEVSPGQKRIEMGEFYSDKIDNGVSGHTPLCGVWHRPHS